MIPSVDSLFVAKGGFMSLYIGKRQNHGKGWFSFWIEEISLNGFASFITTIVVLLLVLLGILTAFPWAGLLIYALIGWGIYRLVRKDKQKI